MNFHRPILDSLLLLAILTTQAQTSLDTSMIENIAGRRQLNFDGRWNDIIDL